MMKHQMEMYHQYTGILYGFRRLNTVEAEVLLEVAPRSEVSLPYGMEVPVCSE